MDEEGTKRCNKCGENKPLDQFYRMTKSPDGRGYTCKPCSVAAARQWQLDHPEAAREADRRYGASDRSKANRKVRREGPQRERILEQKRESWARNAEETNARTRAKRAEDPDRFRGYAHDKYDRDREKILEQNRQWRLGNLDAVRRQRLKREYGLTPEGFARMLNEQNGCCAICGTEIDGLVERLLDGLRTGIHIDHDHASGKVRGLLCSRCNKGLGHFKDDLVRMRAAIAYLETHQARIAALLETEDGGGSLTA